jgi:ankyrin repeat protein
MFPNPQDALPLPPRPNLEQYKKLAKDLVEACASSDSEAIGTWATSWIEKLVRLSGLTISHEMPVRVDSWIDKVEEFARRELSKDCGLTRAQFVIARSHGFESWSKLAKHIQELTLGSQVAAFERAADAIVSGDAAPLERLLRENPELVRARSTREHHATLLHYVSANGVEGYRQKTPANIGNIAEMLLKAGAEVDAEADVYGGGCTTLGLVATSVHPQRAGVQIPLLQTLLGYGADVNYSGLTGNRHSAVSGCLANGQPEAARFLATHGARLDLEGAAGIGKLDVVENFFWSDGALRPGATKEQMIAGFMWACGYGENFVVEFLLGKGIDVRTQDRNGQTGLHWAVIGGHPDIVKLLLRYNPPLELKNTYGGTVLGQALWSAAHGGDPDLYIAILEMLVEHGAMVPERHVPVNAQIDAWLAQHGSQPEPSWYWSGERPRTKRL